ncbi:hypothetical protein ACSZN8_00040 [Aeromonas caviae]|uniref:hypothetical protein n=1 Tax=Aeromonas caviae TaxID=648 RepID=UPI003EC4A821
MSNTREQAWLYMKSVKTFTSAELALAVGMAMHKSYLMVSRYRARGYITQTGGSGHWIDPFSYSANQKANPRFGKGNRSGIATKRRPRRREKSKQQKMWNAMKIERFFTTIDLCITTDASTRHACRYVVKLERAGYLRAVYKVNIKIAGAISRYTLIRDTGSMSPIIRDDGVWDQNEQRLYPFTN